MIETTIKIEGLKCPMCEKHVNETIKGGFDVKKVNTSHVSGQAVIVSKKSIDKDALEKAINALEFKVIEITEREMEKKGFFSFLKK